MSASGPLVLNLVVVLWQDRQLFSGYILQFTDMYSRVKRKRKVVKRDMYGMPIEESSEDDDSDDSDDSSEGKTHINHVFMC